MSKIYCHKDTEFYDTIAALVHRGIIFTADVSRLEITLTGGY